MVVIEDLISTGGSVLEVVDVLREAGAQVLGIVSIFTYGMKKSVDRLAEAKVQNISLTDLDAVAQAAAEEGYIAPRGSEAPAGLPGQPLGRELDPEVSTKNLRPPWVPLPSERSGQSMKRDLIDITDLSVEEIDELIEKAEDIIAHPEAYREKCRYKKLATLFYEPSTRTRLSFESAMLRTGRPGTGLSRGPELLCHQGGERGRHVPGR